MAPKASRNVKFSVLTDVFDTFFPISFQFVCTVIAILLHYFYMCTFAWMFVEGLHIYRMLTEMRNINHGHMRFYYAMGWGIPAIITGEKRTQTRSDELGLVRSSWEDYRTGRDRSPRSVIMTR